MFYKLITPNTALPINLIEVKQHLRVAHSDQDNEITSLIHAARERFEHDTGMCLLTSEWQLILSLIPEYKPVYNANVVFWKNPITEITSVQYFAQDETVIQTLEPEKYIVDYETIPARILFTDTFDVETDTLSALRINFTAGFADEASIPNLIKAALKFLVAHYYENPSHVVTGTQVNVLPDGYKTIANIFTKKIV